MAANKGPDRPTISQDEEPPRPEAGGEDEEPRPDGPGSSGDKAAAAPDPAAPDAAARRRRRIALGLYALVTLVCFLTVARDRLHAHTLFNHFALLAEAWLDGRLDLGGPPPAYTGNNDFALFDGKYHISFPPLPALLLVPFVKLAGGADKLKDGQVFLWFAGIAPAFLFLSLEKLRLSRRSPRTTFQNAALAALFAFGTVYWFSAIQGTVWFAAHVVGAALASIYLYASIGAAHPLLAGLSLGLAFATRTPIGFAFPLFLCEAWRAAQPAGEGRGAVFLRSAARFALPAAAVAAIVFWHNHARFGDPFEFGHRYLMIVWRARIEKWGLFSYHYLGRNLSIILAGLPYTRTQGAPFQINAHGLALWITTPIYAWAIWPRRTSPVFWALAITAGLVALPSLLYQNSGWVQFGYRFSNDFAVFLFAMIAVGGRRMGPPFWALSAWALLVNGFGALTFDRAEAARFYYVDGSQRILSQPD